MNFNNGIDRTSGKTLATIDTTYVLYAKMSLKKSMIRMDAQI